MPAIVALVLTDGTTPVTLSPREHVSGSTLYRATSSLVASHNPHLKYAYRTTTNKVDRSNVTFKQPLFTETDPGVFVSRGEITGEINLMVPPEATQAERLLFVKRLMSLVGTSGNLTTELTTGEGQW